MEIPRRRNGLHSTNVLFCSRSRSDIFEHSRMISMATQEFDEVYFEAREVLYRRGTVVGKPAIGDDGVRRCPINGVWLIDRDLLKEAWGERLTDEILADFAEIPSCCAAFEHLWHAYTLATRHYLRVFADQLMLR